MEVLHLHRECCLNVGYVGAFFCPQLDLTTVTNEENTTFSVSYVAESETTIPRVGLDTRAFPGSHIAEDMDREGEFVCFVVACAVRIPSTPYAINLLVLLTHSFAISSHP